MSRDSSIESYRAALKCHSPMSRELLDNSCEIIRNLSVFLSG